MSTPGAGIAPQATVTSIGGVVNAGAAAGVTVIILEAVIVLPHASVAFHVSVTVPPQAEGVEEKVDGLDVPVIRQPPVNPFV